MLRSCFIRYFLTSVLAFGTVLSTQVVAAEEEAVAIVNGVAVPKSRFDLLLNSQTSQGQEDTPEFRKELLEIMITREILVQEAQRRKMHESKEYAAQVDAMEQQLLISTLFNQLIVDFEPTDEAKMAEYLRIKTENDKMGRKEYLVRHILVEDANVANDIIKKLAGGADFAALAKEFSADTGTKENGGQLDWSVPEAYVEPFAKAIVALKKGERSATPVLSNFGYHVIEVLDVRAQPFPDYEQVKEELRKDMITKSRDEMITKLRKEAKIEKVGELDTKK